VNDSSEEINTFQHVLWMLNNFVEEFDYEVYRGNWHKKEALMLEEFHKFKQIASFLNARIPPEQEKRDLTAFLSRVSEVDNHISKMLKIRSFW
jgi:hypothetical protein